MFITEEQQTKDQKVALNNMLEWAKNNVWRHTLNGAAGTGKTTITRLFINKVRIPSYKIAVTAPTHKAKKVIAKATGYRAQTIQKLLGLRPNVEMDNFNPNRPVFLPLADDAIGDYSIVIIDEASMLNTAAFNLIKEKAEKYGVKVLFLGDSYQLPPVGEFISPVFKGEKEYISTLSTVVRQESTNPMTQMLINMREDIKFKSNKTITQMIQNGRDLYSDTGYKVLKTKAEKEGEETFGNALLKMYLSTEYEYNPDYIKFLAWTNKSVETWSEAIRNKILKDKARDLNKDEFLIGYKTIVNKKYNKIIIENSEDYRIVHVEKRTSDEGFLGYDTVIVNSNDVERRVFIIDYKDEETEKAFINKVMTLISEAGKDRRQWKQYYKFVESHLSLKTYNYPGSQKTLIGKSLYYSYGITVHKSQGSTYDNVAVNLPNLYLNRKDNERNRLIYVALSRASKMNILMN